MYPEMGFLFQNLVHRLLLERIKDDSRTLHFWRTKDGAEVDFIIDIGHEAIPVEVKCREMNEKSIARPLRGFISKYHPKEAWVVNMGLRDEEMVDHTKVKFIPVFDLI